MLVLPIFCFTNIVDMTMSVIFGIIRALGIQEKVVLITIACFYLLSVPLAAYQAYVVKDGIAGLWLGYFAGIVFLLLIIAVYILRTDWDAIAKEAEQRIVNDVAQAYE